MNISLSQSAKSLSEVVVVGYGTTVPVLEGMENPIGGKKLRITPTIICEAVTICKFDSNFRLPLRVA